MSTQNAPLPDLVCDNKIETNISGDVICHIIDEAGKSTNERRVRREERWAKQKLLGQGMYGAVYLQRRQNHASETLRAVKEIRKCVTPGQELEYTREIEAIMKFSHSKYKHCFVSSQGWYEGEKMVYITMEFIELGDLQRHLTKALPERETIQIVAQVLEGLVFMHDNKFIHRDLKPANIMVVTKAPNWVVKIADFGISKRRHHGVTTNLTMLRGTLGFAAPETIISKDSYTFSVDMWSLGAVAYKILTNKILFEDVGDLMQYAFGNVHFPNEAVEFTAISKRGQEFIANLMQLKPEDRMTAVLATKHSWVAPYLEAQSGLTSIEAEKSLVEETTETFTSEGNSAENNTLPNTDQERTIRPFYYNYKAPYVSDCLEEFETHSGQKLPADSCVCLDEAVEEKHDAVSPTSLKTLVADKSSSHMDKRVDNTPLQLSLRPSQQFRYCVACLSQGFEFDSPELQCGHVMCFPCYNRELKVGINNPQNVTHKCCISGTLYPEDSHVILNQARTIDINPKTILDKSEINNWETTAVPHIDKDGKATEHDEVIFHRGTMHHEHLTLSDGSELDDRERDKKHDCDDDEWPESYRNHSDPGPGLNREDYFKKHSSQSEHIADSRSVTESDLDYDSEYYLSTDSMKPGPTNRILSNITCNHCKLTWACSSLVPIGPFERLPCQHYICHTCLIQFLALLLISPKHMKPRCCDHELGEISEYSWRNIIVDPQVNIAWEKIKQLDDSWTCRRIHPPKGHSLIVTSGSIPIWKPTVSCSVCLTESRRGIDPSPIRNTEFCLFCSEEVGPGGCKSCDYDSVIWSFVYRLKNSGVFNVPRIADIISEACRVKENMNLGKAMNYQRLEDLRNESPRIQPENPNKPPSRINKTNFDQPPATHHTKTSAAPSHSFPQTQNTNYSQPVPHPDYGSRGKNINYNPPFYPIPNCPPHNWTSNYPPPNLYPSYTTQGETTYHRTPYSGLWNNHILPTGISTPDWKTQSHIVVCYRCSKENVGRLTDNMIICTCGASICVYCHGPSGACQYGCVLTYKNHSNGAIYAPMAGNCALPSRYPSKKSRRVRVNGALGACDKKYNSGDRLAFKDGKTNSGVKFRGYDAEEIDAWRRRVSGAE